MCFNNDKVCSICLEPTEKYFMLCCKQSYHPKCLLEWIKQVNSCPICKCRFADYYIPCISRLISEKSESIADSLRWSIITGNNYIFCRICNLTASENITCGGYHYHLECIKDRHDCPECDYILPNETIYQMYKAYLEKNIFHENFLSHRLIMKTKRKLPPTPTIINYREADF